MRTAWLFIPGMQKFDILVYGFKNVAPNLAHNIDASLHVKHFGDESKSERFTHTEHVFKKLIINIKTQIVGHGLGGSVAL